MAETQNIPVFNPVDYPLVYERRFSRLEFVIFLLGVTLFSFLISLGLVLALQTNAGWQNGDILKQGCFLLILIILTFDSLHYSITVTSDSILVRSLFHKYHIKRSEIKGWHSKRDDFFDRKIWLVPLDPKADKIPIVSRNFLGFKTDETFDQWIKSLPNLHQHKEDRYYNAIKTCNALGRSPESRVHNMQRLGRFIGNLNGFLVFVCFLIWITPFWQPFTLFAIGLITLITLINIFLVIRFPVLWLTPPAEIKHVSLYITLYLWGAFIFFWLFVGATLTDLHLLNTDLPLNIYTLIILVTLCAPLFSDRAWKRLPKRILISAFGIYFSLMGFYLAGNILLDHSKPSIKWDKWSFAIQTDTNGTIRKGCEYVYGGAFSSEWSRYKACPENFQKTEVMK